MGLGLALSLTGCDLVLGLNKYTEGNGAGGTVPTSSSASSGMTAAGTTSGSTSATSSVSTGSGPMNSDVTIVDEGGNTQAGLDVLVADANATIVGMPVKTDPMGKATVSVPPGGSVLVPYVDHIEVPTMVMYTAVPPGAPLKFVRHTSNPNMPKTYTVTYTNAPAGTHEIVFAVSCDGPKAHQYFGNFGPLPAMGSYSFPITGCAGLSSFGIAAVAMDANANIIGTSPIQNVAFSSSTIPPLDLSTNASTTVHAKANSLPSTGASLSASAECARSGVPFFSRGHAVPDQRFGII